MSGRRKTRVKRRPPAEIPVDVEEDCSAVASADDDDHFITVKEEVLDLPEDPLSLEGGEAPPPVLVLLPKEPLPTAKCYKPFRKRVKLDEASSSQRPKTTVLPQDSSHPLIVLKALSAVSKELNQAKATEAMTKDLNCKICSYTTNRSNNLARHMHTMHSLLPEPQECCSQTFTTRYDHQEHNREFHASSKYPCHFPECQKAQVVFERRGLLKRHVIGVHQRQKPFKCDYCSYQSSHKSNLDRHSRTQHASYFLSPTLDAEACSIVIDMDPTAVMKFKLDDDTFNVRPKAKVKEELEEEDPTAVSVKEEPLDSEEEEPVYPEVTIKSEPPDEG